MAIVPFLLVVAAAGAPAVEVSTLKGDSFKGELQKLTATTLTLQQTSGITEIPVAQILEVRGKSDEIKPAVETGLAFVQLADGSRVGCTKVSTSSRNVTVESPLLGSFSIPLTAVANIRFTDAAAKIEAAWKEICERQTKTDLLVIRKKQEKGDILDHLGGVVGDIGDQSIKFLLDGDAIPVKREKVFGVVYFRRETDIGKPVCQVELTGSNVIQVTALDSDGEKLNATLLTGAKVSVPLASVRGLNFSLGKLRYLSQMEPREVKYTPLFDITWEYRRDRNQDGDPLRLGTKTYSRGLWIHSKTYLRYRIGTDFRRFQAVMGIDKKVAPNGDVHVVISGDGKPLFEADVRGVDEPRSLDLDVKGVRDLEILVDFGGDLDISDHLDLANAKVIK